MELIWRSGWYRALAGQWQCGMVCETCQSLFVVNEDDISFSDEKISRSVITPYYDRSRKSFVYYDVCCPACGHQMSVGSLPPVSPEGVPV